MAAVVRHTGAHMVNPNLTCECQPCKCPSRYEDKILGLQACQLWFGTSPCPMHAVACGQVPCPHMWAP